MTPSSRPKRHASAAFALAFAVVAAACSSSTPPAQPTAPASSPSAQASGTASAPATSPSAPACPTSSLHLSTGTSQGAAAGSTYVSIVFTNIGTATCTLYGYPGVSLAGGAPVSQIGAAADEDPATPRQLVTLMPGARASALLRIVDAHNFPASRCHIVTATYLQVYPPNQTTPGYVAYSAAACSKPVHLLTVDVVKPGAGG